MQTMCHVNPYYLEWITDLQKWTTYQPNCAQPVWRFEDFAIALSAEYPSTARRTNFWDIFSPFSFWMRKPNAI
jgi:hypothetical protein